MEIQKLQAVELVADQLIRSCDPQTFGFQHTGDLAHAPLIIGQDRAMESLHFGLEIESPGFNLFVMGASGTGRHSILQRLVAEQAAQSPTPSDWVYVNHFVTPGAPRAISLPPGMGAQFRTDMERFSAGLLDRLQQAFETDQYGDARERLEQALRTAQQQELIVVDELAQEQGFALVRSASGLYIAPVQDGEILTPEAFSQLPVDERTEMDHAFDQLQDLLNGVMRRMREHERRIQAEIERLDREVADFTVSPLLRELSEKYTDHAEIKEYLDEVREDIVDNVAAFRSGGENDQEEESGSLLNVPLSHRYHVNLLVDNSRIQGAPVIFEETPTYDKLFGRIEYDMRYGASVTDYTLIRPGALHRANGGYLILDAKAVLETPYVWYGLKRALFSGLIRIEAPEGQMLVRTVTPEPEPIPLQLKVILLGSHYIYYALYDYDEDFAKYFKVQVDFNNDMARTPENERAYAHFIRGLSEEERVLPFTPDAVARVVEFGARLCEHQDRLSAQFGQVADVVREASHWASRAGQTLVRRDHVVQALQQSRRRAGLSEDLARREILEGQIVIATEGAAVGEVNGLTVMILGGYTFGVPSRITARAYVGRGDVVDIHREIELGGPIHGKGVLTLTGYFGGYYGMHRSLSMEASLSFEQIYGELDGDSAAAAELYALISALSGVPLRQDLAVTGSMDQAGRIMAIGGVNEKIEGMFAICRARGLTGTQGVVIPRANLKHLMLSEELIVAVREGRFHIYAVSTVDEGLALLTGQTPGVRDATGAFPEGTLHAAVAARLSYFADLADGNDDEDNDARK